MLDCQAVHSYDVRVKNTTIHVVILPWNNPECYIYTNQYRHCNSVELNELFKQHSDKLIVGKTYYCRETLENESYRGYYKAKKANRMVFVKPENYSDDLMIVMKTTQEEAID